MKHLYLFTLEVAPLVVGRIYEELPSHLTLMSRFTSDLPPEELAVAVHPLFASTAPMQLVFGETVALGQKKVTAYIIISPEEMRLHQELRNVLDVANVAYQYLEFTGGNHIPHVTERENVKYRSGDRHLALAVYLIEVVDKKRVVRTRFELKAA